jgi:hypothetical protein
LLNRALVLPIKQINGSKRLRWFGHVSTKTNDRLPYYLLDWKPEHGKRSRGRTRKDLNDVYIEVAEEKLNRIGITVDNMKDMAADRKRWRYLTHCSCIIRDDTVDAD